ncbi:right-handed parallel beta-helix repeat-containing protein [Tropicimonas sediminicola]|uniref:Copper-binding protein (NosD) n=1 Tax=Tropicimonas sediminicola TaxID=1031541 RepID=A0A239ML55_9RHOB|nr:right-handed parallel beta-helix repeat-containing protein [Tropicimonas sediminicola]SNT43003.1 copper-binding protein (NosD) [Tropicimonas sediminicola]
MPELRRISRRLRAGLLAALCLCPLPPQASAQSLPEAGRLVEMDFRLVMAAMAQRVGANGQLGLIRAQLPENAPALAVVGGQFDLSGLSADHDAVHAGWITMTPDGAITLHRPLVVWEGAALSIPGNAELALNRATGAFLLNLGTLSLTDATVLSAGEASAASPDFRPFVLTAGTGAAEILGGRFDGLGYDGAPAFAGFAIVNGGIFPAIGRSQVERSDFRNLEGLYVDGTKGADLRNNAIHASRGGALTLKQTTDTSVSGNLIRSASQHGIRITSGATSTRLHENRVESAGKIGIFIDGASRDVLLERNLVTDAESDGVLVRRAHCVQLRQNAVRASGGNGIEIRQSTSVTLSGNRLEHSRRAGVLLSQQPPGTETALSANVFMANTTGLSGAAPARLHLVGNDFTGQFPRLVAGDLALVARGLFADPAGAHPVILEPAGGTALSGFRSDCPVMEGY